MLIDVVGIQHKQGTVEGRPYEFFEVHSLVPDAQVEGQAVDVIKLKPMSCLKFWPRLAVFRKTLSEKGFLSTLIEKCVRPLSIFGRIRKNDYSL